MISKKKLFAFLLIIVALGSSIYFYKYRETKLDPNIAFVMEAYDKIQEYYWASKATSSPADRLAVLTQVTEQLKSATTTDAKRELALTMVASTLYNLEPKGRNALLSTKQEKEFRDVVKNVNPSTGQVEPTVNSRMMGKTLYLGIKQIAPQTLQELGAAIDAASTTPADSLVIDLRSNIGGALDFLPAFLGLFIGPDQYAFDLYSRGEKSVLRTTLPKYEPLNRFGEIALLSSSSTQSTAELTIDAFRRYRLGKSVGEKTRGWGTIENTYPLSTPIDPETQYTLLLVNSLTVRGDNQPIEGNGVMPDIDTGNASWKAELKKKFNSPSLINALTKLVSP